MTDQEHTVRPQLTLNTHELTGRRIQFAAHEFASELSGIMAIVDLLRDAQTLTELDAKSTHIASRLIDGHRRNALLGAAGSLAEASYLRLIDAVGDENPFSDKTLVWGGEASIERKNS
ncbi:MAG: hypothetical protein U9Q81_05055 [Pseudomonadota bacterium]|nr:hypothetical protein [Pseudomonadota bacterium]